MTCDRPKVLALAVASKRIAFVFLIGGQLKDWKYSRSCRKSVAAARSFLRIAVLTYEPDLVVIENPMGHTRKTGRSRAILQGLAQELSDSATPHALVERKSTHRNKYLQAKELAERHPLIKTWLPQKPRIWQTEPTAMIYFEALAMAEQSQSSDEHPTASALANEHGKQP